MDPMSDLSDLEEWPSPSAVPFRTGDGGERRVELELLLDVVALGMVARTLDLTLDAMLEQIERWAANEGLPYGVTVDREKQTISQAGEA
jgi:hypothetical protein